MNNFALLILRVFTGSFMIIGHGLPKLNLLFASGEITFSDPLGIGTFLSLALATFAEYFCSILLIVGLFTRASLIPLIITMFVAAFIHQSGEPFSQIEKAVLFLLIFIFLFITGSGKYAVGKIVKVKTSNKFIKYLFE